MQERFASVFGRDHQFSIAVPGRTELGGNHTDHQHGPVLAAPVRVFVVASASENGTDKIRIDSEGFEPFESDLFDLCPRAEEQGLPVSLLKGVASAFAEKGLRGFDACIRSDIPVGSGLSSSAAFEILLAKLCCRFSGVQLPAEELAKIAQRAENEYFGKPSGLMDQMACASEGPVFIDLKDPASPVVCPVRLDPEKHGYALCLVRCGAGHEDLTDQYRAITREMGDVARYFGKDVLREVAEELFFAEIPALRLTCGDRAVLRAVHFFEEVRRVTAMKDAVERDDFETFLSLVRGSGRSSCELLQNVIPEGSAVHQDMAVALAFAEKALEGTGAVRVHGGGFGGTIQAYVPFDKLDPFKTQMEALFGPGCCIDTKILSAEV